MLSSADQGKTRLRTNAPSVGAAQRLGPNLEKLSDTAECFAVEGTVTGELGRQHYACGVAVGIIGGRVPPGSRGGPVSVEDKKAAAEAPIEMFVLAEEKLLSCPPPPALTAHVLHSPPTPTRTAL